MYDQHGHLRAFALQNYYLATRPSWYFHSVRGVALLVQASGGRISPTEQITGATAAAGGNGNGGHTNTFKQFSATLERVGSFDTVEDFWSHFVHLESPSKLRPGRNVMIFRENLIPAWEVRVLLSTC